MSANNGNADTGYQFDIRCSANIRTNAPSGMELHPSRYSIQYQLNESSPEVGNMSLAIQNPPRSMLPFPRDMWHPQQDRRPAELPSRPRSQTFEKVELPPIRQILGQSELPSRTGRTEGQYRIESETSYSPVSGLPASHALSGYTSPILHKRRRLSFEDEPDPESREAVIPRLFMSPPRPAQRPHSAALSPNPSIRRPSVAFSSTSSSRTSPDMSSGPPPYETSVRGSEWRPTLPSLPSLTLAHNAAAPRGRTVFGEYALDSSQARAQAYPQLSTSVFDPPVSTYHHQNSFTYGYQQPRGQSYSGPSSYTLTHNRTPFSSAHHVMYPGSSYPYGLEVNDGNDSKQRKRRGNLPKETTDKLRAWFVAHLQHPYPTEDEKQELMRQTGLQMNQISNWFINARRRQLPAMINNARAESDARSARSDQGLSQLEGANFERGASFDDRVGSDYGEEKRNSGSDGEGSAYDADDFELRRRAVSVHGMSVHEVGVTTKRESI